MMTHSKHPSSEQLVFAPKQFFPYLFTLQTSFETLEYEIRKEDQDESSAENLVQPMLVDRNCTVGRKSKDPARKNNVQKKSSKAAWRLHSSHHVSIAVRLQSSTASNRTTVDPFLFRIDKHCIDGGAKASVIVVRVICTERLVV